MVGYDFLMTQLENRPPITLSEPFKSNAETVVKANNKKDGKMTRTLPTFEGSIEKLRYKFGHKTFGDKIPCLDNYSVNEYWNMNGMMREHKLAFLRASFRLDARKKKECRYFHVNTKWIQKDITDQEDNFDDLKDTLEDSNSAYQLYEKTNDSGSIFYTPKSNKVHNLISKIPESFVLIHFSRMLHINPGLKNQWETVTKSDMSIGYKSLYETEHLGCRDIGMMTVIALMVSNLIFSTSHAPFDKKSPFCEKKPDYQTLKMTLMEDLMKSHHAKRISYPLIYFERLFRDQLCAFMIYQFLEAYGLYGSNPDFLESVQGEHGLYAFLFLTQISGCDKDAKIVIYERIVEKAITLFEHEAAKLSRVKFALRKLKDDEEQQQNIYAPFAAIESKNAPTMFGGLLLMYHKWIHDKCSCGDLQNFTFHDNVKTFMAGFGDNKFDATIFKDINESNMLDNTFSFKSFMKELTSTYRIETHFDIFFPGTMTDLSSLGKSMPIGFVLLLFHNNTRHTSLTHHQFKPFI